MHHRGPDESGAYVDDRIGLGHARLSIIDLAGGTQPIHNEDETIWIVYNGEVFNYPELRDDLIKKGHRFYTTSDTEVIIHLYEELGPDCLEYLNGQFAFAIWNAATRELFLARDRVGIRPLYYTQQSNSIIFASEIKSLFMVDDVPRQIDPIAMDQIFTFWTTLQGRTAFEGVSELPPGHYMLCRGDRIEIKKYWDIPFCPPAEQPDVPIEQTSERIMELLLDAVRIRLRADVPVGAYLSGGLDSSGVTALVSKNFNNRLKTFGIRFGEAAFDEGPYQRQMVKQLAVDHSELMVTNEQIGRAFADVIRHCERPLLRTAPVPLYLLSGLVAQNGFKVVLTGEGADEIFGGYNIFREAKVRRFWARQPDSTRRAALIGRLYPYIFDNPRLGRMLQAFFAQGLDRPDDPLFSHFVRWQNTSKCKAFFSEDLNERVGSYNGYDQIKQSLPADYGRWDYLAKAQYLETTIFLSDYLLSSQGDRVAMAHSVEMRLPYLDRRLIEFMAQVPAKWKILGLDEKHILKRVFRNVLPAEVANRPKHPYRAPISKSLLNDKAGEYADQMLSQKCINEFGLFDSTKVTRLVQRLRSGSASSEVDNMALAGIFSTQILYHRFVDDFRARPDCTVDFKLLVDRRRQFAETKN